MQLYILGKNSDDKGTQLEQLTVKILEHQGLEEITTNIQGAGGNEIDITAYSRATIGISQQKTKVIGECKAHKYPINTTDWLKFIGKVHYARENGTHAIGLMVCLSGANGAVIGMYNEKHCNDDTIQLIANGNLITLISECFDIEIEANVRRRIIDIQYDDIYEMNLLYYDKQIYWVISFMNGKYTINCGKGNLLAKEDIEPIFPLLTDNTPYSCDNYIDIGKHVQQQQYLKSVNVAALTTLVTGRGRTVKDVVKHIYDSKQQNPISTSLLEMALEQNPFITFNKDTSMVVLKDESEIDMVDFYQYILTSEFSIDLVISDFYQEHINVDILDRIQKIQYGIEIPKEKVDDCIFLLKHSPTALFYALTPNGLFHAYESVKNCENMRTLYISYFEKMLIDGFVSDVKNQDISDMYRDFFKIEKMKVLSNVEIEIDGVKRTFNSCARFGLAKLQDYNRSVVCVLAE